MYFRGRQRGRTSLGSQGNGAVISILPNGNGGFDPATGLITTARGGATTFTRATTAINPSTWAVAAINYPRVNVGTGILMEPARTNVSLQSEDFTNAAWSVSAGGASAAPTRTANTSVAPDGNTTADRIQVAAVTTGPDQSVLFSTTAFTATAAAWTLSFWIKGTSGSGSVPFQFVNTGFTAAAGLTTANYTTTWTRVSTTATLTAAAWRVVIGSNLGAAYATGANTAQDFQIWGLQVELGNTASSYIATTSAAVTRNADVLSFVPGTKNLILRSQALATAPWTTAVDTSGSITVTNNDDVAPDGTSTATRVQQSATLLTPSHPLYAELFQQFTATAETYTYSFWIKGKSGPGSVNVRFQRNAAISAVAKQLVNYDTTWQRVTGTATLTAFTDWLFVIGNDQQYTTSGAPAVDALVWGVQVELSAQAGPYVATTSTAVQVSNFPIASGEVSFNYTPINATQNSNATVLDTKTGNDGIDIRIGDNYMFISTGNGTLDSNFYGSGAIAWVPGQQYRIRFRWSGGVTTCWRDDVLLNTYSAQRMPTLLPGTVYLGSSNASNSQPTGFISDFSVRAV